MTSLYRRESSDPKRDAQRNLCGRTHYVDDDTLRFHKSRVLSARPLCGGLLYGIVTSDALDMNNTRRGFRFVLFDLLGHVIERPDLEHTFKSSDAASKAMYAALESLNPKALTVAAIKKARHAHYREMTELAASIAKVQL